MGGRQLRIMQVVGSLESGGTAQRAVNLCNRMTRGRYRTSICCLYERGRLEGSVHDDVETACLHRPRGFDPAGPWRAAEAFRKFGADIVHTHGWDSGSWTGILGARLARVPTVINDELGHLSAGRYWVRAAQRYLSRYIAETVIVAESLREDITRVTGMSAEHVTCIPNGVDTAQFRPSVLRGQRARQEWGIGERELVIGTAGRLVPSKEHGRLIEACRELAREIPFRLVIAGTGPERTALERRAVAAGIGHLVCFTGFQSDMTAIINMMDVFVLPSREEGMPGVLMEAMSCARPVLAVAAGGVRDVIDDGESGMLIRSNDPRALFTGLRSLVSSPWRNGMGYAARRHVEREFGIDTMIRRYEALFEYCGEYDRRRRYQPFPEPVHAGAGDIEGVGAAR